MNTTELKGDIFVTLNEKGLIDVHFSSNEGRIMLIKDVHLSFGDKVQIKDVTMEFEVSKE